MLGVARAASGAAQTGARLGERFVALGPAQGDEPFAVCRLLCAEGVWEAQEETTLESLDGAVTAPRHLLQSLGARPRSHGARYGGTALLAMDIGAPRLAASVVVRIVDAQGDLVKLPRDSSAREHIAHALRGRTPLCAGFRVRQPAQIVYDAVVVRCVPRDQLVLCAHPTSVTFDEEESADGSGSPGHAEAEGLVAPAAVTAEGRRQSSSAVRALHELVVWPSQLSGHFSHFPGLGCPRGILLHGSPGTGKTTAVHYVRKALQETTSCGLFEMRALVGAQSTHRGAVEGRLRETFAAAQDYVERKGALARAIVFLDELDGICPKRERTRADTSRAVAQLLTLMDGLQSQDDRITVIGATNQPDALDPALRRPGRFEKEIAFRPPDQAERLQILLGAISADLGLSLGALDGPLMEGLERFARSCVGFVGADLEAVVAEVAAGNVASQPNELLRHLELARARVGTAAGLRARGRAMTAPAKSVRVGGYADVKLEIQKAVEWPRLHSAAMQRMCLEPPRGVLLHGPPGCCKTTLARAVASDSGHSFFALSGADVYSPYVGEAERQIREVFATARLALPAVIFLDEIDALVGKRALDGGAGGDDEGATVQSRVLATLLNEMDGVQSAKGLFVLGATNRIDMIDKALLRPGRFDRLVHVPLPSLADRSEILEIHLAALQLDPALGPLRDLAVALAEHTEGRSGAELENLCREAAFRALRRDTSPECCVRRTDLFVHSESE